MARATCVETARRARPLRCRARRLRGAGHRLAADRRSRPRRVRLRIPAARGQRPAAAVVASLPDAGDAHRRRYVARCPRRCPRGATPRSAVRGLDRRLERRWALVRAMGRSHGGSGAPRLPGIRPALPRALERAALRGGLRPLCAPSRPGWRPAVRLALRSGGARRRARGPRPARERRARPPRALPVRPPGTIWGPPCLGGCVLSRCGASARRLGGAQRRPLRRVDARARRQRDRPLLPGVHHRPHRRRPRTGRRRAGSRTPCARISSPASRIARTASPSTRSSTAGASASTRISTSSRTRSSAGTRTTRCCGTPVSRACAPSLAHMPRASSRRSGFSSASRCSVGRVKPQLWRSPGLPRTARTAGCRRRPRGSRFPADRSSGSRVRTTRSGRNGSRPLASASRSPTRLCGHGSRRSSAGETSF